MKTIFYSGFGVPDDRWKTRHVIDGEADARCVEYRDGILRLRIKKSPEKIVTAHISTADDFTFTYGLAEARMKFMSPQGAHSSFWLQTTEDYIPGQAEVDVVEHFGKNSLWHNVYWRELGQNAGEFTSAKIKTKVVDPTSWHTYGVNWSPTQYDFMIDGAVVASTQEGLSDRPKMLVLSILIADWERENLQTDALWRYRTQVDWVKVSQ